MSVGLPLEIPPSLPCPFCQQVLPLTGEMVGEYLVGRKSKCSKCAREIDIWEVILQSIRQGAAIFGAFSIAAARTTLGKLMLEPGKTSQVDFDGLGIPADAKILSIGYTPGPGGLFPLEFHGNWPTRHIVPRPLSLYPVALGPGPHTSTEVTLGVVWVPHRGTDYAYENLVSAVEAYTVNKFETMVIPANVAVELTLSQFLTRFLQTHASRERVEKFLQDDATYGHQLNVLLPTLVGFRNLPKMPEHIRGLLNRLKDLRNDMAHRGFLEPPLGRDEAAACLAAAFFGLAYLVLMDLFMEGKVEETSGVRIEAQGLEDD